MRSWRWQQKDSYLRYDCQIALYIVERTPYILQQMQYAIQVATKYKEVGVNIIQISVDQNDSGVIALGNDGTLWSGWWENKDLSWKQVSTPTKKIGAQHIPQQPQERHLCVDEEGRHFNAVYPSRCVECGKLF
jgi:hypothetical protein